MPHPVIVVIDDNTDYLTFMTTLLAFSDYDADAAQLAEAFRMVCVPGS